MIYVGIIGSRRRDSREDYLLVAEAFARIWIQSTVELRGCPITIVSGGCRQGGDRFAEILIDLYGTGSLIHLPDKSAYPELREPLRSTKQNYERNTLVARDSQDYLIACVASDRRGGTEDTIKKWKRFYPTKEPILV